jgi:predicted membrane protein
VVANLLGSVEIVLPEGLPVSVTGLTLVGKRQVLDETSNGFGHGADYASEEFAAGSGQRLRLAVFSGVGSIDTVRSAAPVGVTPEPSRVL